ELPRRVASRRQVVHGACRDRRGAPRIAARGAHFFDVGAHTHQIASQWHAHAPKTFHITNAWSSMASRHPPQPKTHQKPSIHADFLLMLRSVALKASHSVTGRIVYPDCTPDPQPGSEAWQLCQKS